MLLLSLTLSLSMRKNKKSLVMLCRVNLETKMRQILKIEKMAVIFVNNNFWFKPVEICYVLNYLILIGKIAFEIEPNFF